MVVTLDIKTGEVLGVRESPGIPIERLADIFANCTRKIWEAELKKQAGEPSTDKKGAGK